MGKHPTVTLSPFERALNRVPSLPAKDAKIVEEGLLWILARKREIEAALAADRARIAAAVRKEMEFATSEEEIEMAQRLLRVVEGG